MRSVSRPSKRMLPERTFSRGEGSRPTIALAVRDFPEPDSPTTHSVSPGDRSSDALATANVRSLPGGSSIERSRILSIAAQLPTIVRSDGLFRSLIASERRVTASTVTSSARPGKTLSHQACRNTARAAPIM